jgi:hypothetical protein
VDQTLRGGPFWSFLPFLNFFSVDYVPSISETVLLLLLYGTWTWASANHGHTIGRLVA